MIDDALTDPETGEIEPVVTIVTDNGGPFRSFTFEVFITAHPELRHVRTRVRTPGQNGSRERGFGSMKYEWLFREQIDDALQLVDHEKLISSGNVNHQRDHHAERSMRFPLAVNFFGEQASPFDKTRPGPF